MITPARQLSLLLTTAILAFLNPLAHPVEGRAEAMARLERPRVEAACQAMQTHVAELVDQHRRSEDLDDAAFGKVLSLFYEAQSACTLGRFDEALDIYTAIPIGRVSPHSVR